MKRAVAGMLRTVGLHGLADEYPGQLSGGQQQRVGLARCLVVGPEVVLFDEPLSNVDARVRRLLRRELVAMQREFGFAGVYVTHDQEEAMQVADRVVLMRNGRAEQVGAPSELYARPGSRYAASFLGEINEIPGVLMQNDCASQEKARHALVRTEAGPLLEAELVGAAAPSDEVVIAIRPHHLGIARRHAEDGGKDLEGHIERQISVGTHIEFIVRIKCGTHVTIWSPTNHDDLRPGTDVLVTLHSDHVIAFPASDSIQ